MIQMQTFLGAADNSGAKKMQCLKVLGGSKRKYASIGDIIVVTVKEAIPKGTSDPEGRSQEGDLHPPQSLHLRRALCRILFHPGHPER